MLSNVVPGESHPLFTFGVKGQVWLPPLPSLNVPVIATQSANMRPPPLYTNPLGLLIGDPGSPQNFGMYVTPVLTKPWQTSER